MVRSMTGFGTSKARSKHGTITAEIKTVNHKYLEVSVKLTPSLYLFEENIKSLVQKDIRRGKVYLTLAHEGICPDSDILHLDLGLAENYFNKLTEIKKHFKLKEEISLKDIASFQGVLSYRVTEKETLVLWPVVQEAVVKAVKRLIHERDKEGRHLAKDLAGRIAIIKKHITIINSRAKASVKTYKKKLEEKAVDAAPGTQASAEKIDIEVALFAKNSDISEEVTRLTGHLINFTRILKSSGETGKKLDFIAQEMHREINTIGAKSSDYDISTSVIEVKGEIEKIREQVKNIE